MASNARCLCFFFLLALSFSLQIQARESKFFSKFTHHYLRRKTQENPESVGLSPAQSPSLAPAPAPESDVFEHGYGLYGHEPVESTNGVGEVKYVEGKGLGKKTFRDFVMAYPNDNGNGWSGNKNERKGMSDTRFLENGKYYYDVNNEMNGNEKQGMSEYVEENSFPENRENGNEHEYETEKHGMGEKRYQVNGKYYSGYVTGENGNENEKQGMNEYVEDENKGNGHEYETEKQGMSEKRYLVNGKYYSGYVTGENGNGNGKLGMNEYVEEENNFPKNKEDGNQYETEKQGMGEKMYLVNGKYYSGYVTKSENGNENDKQGMSEHVEENNLPENEGDGNESEIEKQGLGEKKYFVNGKYYSGYVTGSQNEDEYEKQGMNEYVEENNFSENQGNGNGYQTKKQGMGEKYLVNGKYYDGYVTGSENRNENEKQGKNEYVEEDNSFPENKENGNEFENEKQGMGEKKYFVNGKYYSGYVTGSGNENEKQGRTEYVEEENSFPENKENGNEFENEKQGTGEKMYLVNGKYYRGYVTKSENGNENEKQGMSEYVDDEDSFVENKGNENDYETKNQRKGEKRYLVNGKYYYGYVTGENRDQNNQNYNSYEDFNKKHEYVNGNNEKEFFNGNNKYEGKQEYVP